MYDHNSRREECSCAQAGSNKGALTPTLRFPSVALLAISIYTMTLPCLADSCDSARADEKAKLQEYLRTELSYEVKKFSIAWIKAKRTEFSSSDLLIEELTKAKSAKDQLELEFEQAENAYHAAHATVVSECPQ
jgi:hypothetical protein